MVQLQLWAMELESTAIGIIGASAKEESLLPTNMTCQWAVLPRLQEGVLSNVAGANSAWKSLLITNALKEPSTLVIASTRLTSGQRKGQNFFTARSVPKANASHAMMQSLVGMGSSQLIFRSKAPEQEQLISLHHLLTAKLEQCHGSWPFMS